MSRSSQPSQGFWPQPKDITDVGDDLENIAALTAFLGGSIAQGGEPCGGDYMLSQRGMHGLWIVLTLIEEHIDLCNEIISETKFQTA